ncbi:hypothetical protein KAH85_00535 [Candidatus Bathyarchaeota archaeon]|jgi:UPF0271 protein|nr:hypothetical protein [Candidatus Bathyarchaeota archaeon]
MPKGRILILDASAFISGFDPLSVHQVQYSVPAVKDELTSGSLPWTRLTTASKIGRLRIKPPKSSFLSKVEDVSKTIGDLLVLSNTDKQLLALAFEFKEAGCRPLIITDDYSMQNVAHKLGVEFSALMTLGIRYRFRWLIYCPACYHKFPGDYGFKSCSICGTKLKRKPVDKVRV